MSCAQCVHLQRELRRVLRELGEEAHRIGEGYRHPFWIGARQGVGRAIDAIVAVLATEPPPATATNTCIWLPCEDFLGQKFVELRIYDTACGHEYEDIHGADNDDMVWCPFCGKRLHEWPIVQPPPATQEPT